MVEPTESAAAREVPILSAPALNTLARTTEWYAKASKSLQDEIVRFTTARIESDVAPAEPRARREGNRLAAERASPSP